MGTLYLEEEKYHKEKITEALKKHGLEPVLDYEWEVHGPHMDMNYQVYVGRVEKNKKGADFVAIYPDDVYSIEDIDNWHRCTNENKIN